MSTMKSGEKELDLARAVLAEYDLGEVRSAAPLADDTPDGGRAAGPVLLVETDSGRYVLKVVGDDGFSEDNMLHMAAFASHLAAKGILAPVPLPARSRLPFVPWEGRWAFVSKYIHRRFIDVSPGSPGDCELAGSAVGTFHLAAADFRSSHEPPAGSLEQPVRFLQRIAGVDLDGLAEALEAADFGGDGGWTDDGATDNPRLLAGMLGELRSRLQALSTVLPVHVYVRLPRGTVLRDFRYGRYRVTPEGQPAVFGVEQAAPEVLLANVAVALDVDYGRFYHGTARGDHSADDLRAASAFLRGYGQVRPLGELEVVMLPHVMWAWWLSDCLYDLGRFLRARGGMVALLRRLRHMDWIMANCEMICNLCSRPEQERVV